jgi:hypothetical protein
MVEGKCDEIVYDGIEGKCEVVRELNAMRWIFW